MSKVRVNRSVRPARARRARGRVLALLSLMLIVTLQWGCAASSGRRAGMEEYAADLQQSLSTSQAALNETESQLQAARSGLQDREAELKTARRELAAMRGDTDRTIASLRRQLILRDASITGHTKALAGKDKLIADLNARIAQLQRETSNLKKQIALIQARHQAAIKKRDDEIRQLRRQRDQGKPQPQAGEKSVPTD